MYVDLLPKSTKVSGLKTFSAIAAISNRWPREVIKLFVNVRFFSRLKKLNVIFEEKSKNNVRTLKQTAQFMF